MRIAINAALLIIMGINALSQNAEYLFTDILQSPNRKYAIATDFIMSEIGGYPYKSTFYKLPFEENVKGIKIINSNNYEWSRDSELFSTQIGIKQVDRQSITSVIFIYNKNGSLIDSIKYGTSLFFIDKSQGIYKNEFGDNGNWIAPRLIRYNLNDRTKEEFYVFSDSLSFFPEQIDLFWFPKRCDYIYRGVRTLMYKKGDPNTVYTFIVNNKNEIIFCKKGDYLNWNHSLPKDGFLNK